MVRYKYVDHVETRQTRNPQQLAHVWKLFRISCQIKINLLSVLLT